MKLPTQLFWKDKRVLVTGATGMVGSALSKWLVKSGASVVGMVADSDPQSDLIRSRTIDRMFIVNGRLERYEDVERAINNFEIDTVFHLGAQPIVGAANRAPRHTFESNIQGTWNVLESCRILGNLVRRVVVASSDKAYGEQATLPYIETMPMNGVHPYEVSKSCADLLCVSYAKTFSLPVVVARCGNIYGPGDLNWNRIIPGTFRSLILGEQPRLRSDGSFVRDFIYVGDVVNAYLILGEVAEREELRGEAFNFSNDQPLSVWDIYQATCNAANKTDTAPILLNSASGEIRDQYLDSSKARDVLGWSASTALGDGLSETFAWYQELFREMHRG